IHQAVNDQAMFSGINRWYARVMTLVVQRRRGDGTQRVVEGREARTRLRSLRVAPPADRFLEGRPLAIGAQRLSQLSRIGFEGSHLSTGEQASTNRRPHLQKFPPAAPAVFHRPASGAIL